MTTETSDLGEVKAELVLQPVDGVARPASKNLNQVVASELTSLKKSVSKDIQSE